MRNTVQVGSTKPLNLRRLVNTPNMMAVREDTISQFGVAKRFGAERRRLGLSLGQAAKRAKVTKESVMNMEHAALTNVGFREVISVAKFYGLRVIVIKERRKNWKRR